MSKAMASAIPLLCRETEKRPQKTLPKGKSMSATGNLGCKLRNLRNAKRNAVHDMFLLVDALRVDRKNDGEKTDV